MAEEKGSNSLRGYKKSQPRFKSWLKTQAPFLFDWKSVFYFGLFLFLLAIAWSANLLIENAGTSLLGWDYTWQFVSFAYDFYDQWHVFFSTGHFPLYDSTIWFGLDNIGSNSYYSLFDPFVVLVIFFPRSWVPFLFSFATFLKLMISGLLMRWYLRYHGISEAASRLGATALAFSGYMMFMVGFPTTVSACVYIPLILLGIDKIIREKKPYCLVIGLFLLGITSFFFLVVACIWGVCYAGWRYLWSIKTRKAKDNVTVILMGVAAFAVGLLMSAWTLLPSLRQTTLSGRSSSIGSAYLSSIISSLKSHDLKSFFKFIFEPVGDHPTRELMGLVSFFYPTGGYLYLPLVHTGYDAWTASVFCYTPFIILFFTGIIISIKKQKWNHIIGILLCLFLLFTNFAYFFFYAFSGNGYGRWFIMLVPEIILYGCWAFDEARKEPKWVRFMGSAISLLGTLATYLLIKSILSNATWPNPNNLTYWQYPDSYIAPADVKGAANAIWYVYVQCAYILVEGLVFVAFNAKKWMPQVWLGLLSVEIIVAGNAASSNYYSIYKYATRYMGGTSNFSNALKVADAIKSDDLAFGRTQIDQTTGSSSEAKSYTTVLGLNGAATFHSLMNFDTEDFALINNMKNHGSTRTTYNDTEVYNPNWSGYYGNKRFATDNTLGYRYYAVKNDYSAWVDFMPANVPFGSEEIYSLPVSGKEERSRYKVYKVGDSSAATLGHAVDSSKLYRFGKEENSYYLNSFYRNETGSSGLRCLIRAEDACLNGAIFEDDAILPEGLSTTATPSVSDVESAYGLKALRCGNGLNCYLATADEGDGLFPKEGLTGSVNDAAYFLDSSLYAWKDVTYSSSVSVAPDRGHLIFSSSTGGYLSDDETGCYIEMKYWVDNDDSVPRVLVFGDVEQEDGTLLTNQLLTFEYSSLYNAKQAGYLSARSSTFGFYVNGHAKYLCFVWPDGEEDANSHKGNLTLYVAGKQKIMQKQAELAESSLKDVKKENANEYSFSTNYSSPKIVVTQLGFDKGWSCVATKEDGAKVNCQMYKLDGGLVGFYAPEGKATYRLSYKTPYLNEGVALAMIGSSAFFGFSIYAFLKKAKKQKENPAQ